MTLPKPSRNIGLNAFKTMTHWSWACAATADACAAHLLTAPRRSEMLHGETPAAESSPGPSNNLRLTFRVFASFTGLAMCARKRSCLKVTLKSLEWISLPIHFTSEINLTNMPPQPTIMSDSIRAYSFIVKSRPPCLLPYPDSLYPRGRNLRSFSREVPPCCIGCANDDNSYPRASRNARLYKFQ